MCACDLCKMNYTEVLKNDKIFLSLTSIHVAEFEYLLLFFEPICESYYKWHTIDGKTRKLPRLKANAKERLPSCGHKLFFILTYLKNNPLQNFQAVSFGFSQGQVSHLFKALNGLLSDTFRKMGLVPAKNNEELQRYLEQHQIKELFQDATERPIARKVDYEAQKEDFSGKKKAHTVKNSVICTQEQYICYISPTYEGKKHDIAILNEESLNYPPNTIMNVDLGYFGYSATNLTVILPHKKPRKSELNLEQKQENTKYSQKRVCNEHAMKGIKRLRIVKDILRLDAYNYADNLFVNACSLHNFRVKSPLRAYARTDTHVTKLKFN